MLGELAAALKEEKDRAAKGYVVARNKGENEMAAYAVAMVAQQLAKVIAKEYRGFDQQAWLEAAGCEEKSIGISSIVSL